MLLGNEAYADAQNPTVGYGTDHGTYGQFASSVYCFMGQVESLLQEELGLMRGLDDDSGRDVRRYPVYNRLRWNFINDTSGGEVAYVMNYGITDQEIDGQKDSITNEKDAQRQYPQGHGDAWGHYLTATKVFYRLLGNPHFVWSSELENVTINGEAVPVGYAHERKFAEAALAKAKAGAEITSLTYRSAYLDDPSSQWTGYLDANTNRAWGVSEWASRAGQGAWLDWVTANALLPASSSLTGPGKVDRTTVSELRELAATYLNIESELDKADTGLNPLGLAKNVMSFDVDPKQIKDVNKTQFEQVYDRAVGALNNAIAVFDYAATCSQMLRQQVDTVANFQTAVREREADFNNRLIEIYGYPYAEDIGPGGTYETGYTGPDLFHCAIVDPSSILGEEIPATATLNVQFKELNVSQAGVVTATLRPVTYQLAKNGLGVIKPASWTQRRAPGEIQNAHSDLLQGLARFKRALKEYDQLVLSISDEATLLQREYALNATEISILDKGKNTVSSLNALLRASRVREMGFQACARAAGLTASAFAEALPLVNGIDNDYTSIARSIILLAGGLVSEGFTIAASDESIDQLDYQNAKELSQLQSNLELTTVRQEQGIAGELLKLQQVVRQEPLLRLDIYNQHEAINQLAGRYQSAVARGQRLLEERLRFRQQTAAQVQHYRYTDMAFRIFRNEALQKYRAQFDGAAMYVYLAAKAYDYETNLEPDDQASPGSAFLNNIVRARTIGLVTQGVPQTSAKGDGGLADAMAQMMRDFTVLKPQLGLNNPQDAVQDFSLRSQFLRVSPSTTGMSPGVRP